jgi:catechol 2,3-dioxygenase-like lactoylglutathione lyase family enzyme
MKSENANPVQALKAHLAINVENVGRSIEFYRKMLGIEPSKVRTGYAKFDVQNPPLNLRRGAYQLLLRRPGQDLGDRPGRQRVGGVRGAPGQPAGDAIRLLLHDK